MRLSTADNSRSQMSAALLRSFLFSTIGFFSASRASQCLCLFFCERLTVRFNPANAIFDLRDSQGHFSLLLLQFLERDDLVSKLGKIRRLARAFAAEVDLAALEMPLLVPDSHPGLLPPNL